MRSLQLSGFILSDDDLIEHLDIDPSTISDREFRRIADKMTEILQESFSYALHNAVTE